jgi:hypothetical protein
VPRVQGFTPWEWIQDVLEVWDRACQLERLLNRPRPPMKQPTKAGRLCAAVHRFHRSVPTIPARKLMGGRHTESEHHV